MPVSTNNDDLFQSINQLEAVQQVQTNLLAGWTRGGGTNPYFDFMEVNQAFFSTPPIESARFRQETDTSIANVSTTPIPWESNNWNTGFVIHSTVAGESTRFWFSGSEKTKRGFLVFGIIQFEQTTVGGDRYINLVTYKPDGTESGNVQVARYGIPVGSTTFPTFPFMHSLVLNSSINAMQIEVFQNSGSSIGMLSAYMTMMRVF